MVKAFAAIVLLLSLASGVYAEEPGQNLSWSTEPISKDIIFAIQGGDKKTLNEDLIIKEATAEDIQRIAAAMSICGLPVNPEFCEKAIGLIPAKYFK